MDKSSHGKSCARFHVHASAQPLGAMQGGAAAITALLSGEVGFDFGRLHVAVDAAIVHALDAWAVLKRIGGFGQNMSSSTVEEGASRICADL